VVSDVSSVSSVCGICDLEESAMPKTTAKIGRAVARAGRAKPRAAANTAKAPPASRRKPSSSPAHCDAGGWDLDQILPEGKLYYRIGEVSEITGVKAYVLRYWESEFRWMSPQKSRSKQRLYRRKDIEMILLIRTLLYEERYTIAGARQRLREVTASKAAGSATTSEPAVDRPAKKDADTRRSDRDRFKRIRNELVAIRASL